MSIKQILHTPKVTIVAEIVLVDQSRVRMLLPTPFQHRFVPLRIHSQHRESKRGSTPVYHVIPSRNSFTTRENSSCISAAAACVRRYSGSTGTTLSGTTSGEVGLAAQTNATSNAISTTTAVIVERYLVMLQLVGVSVKMEMGREGDSGTVSWHTRARASNQANDELV